MRTLILVLGLGSSLSNTADCQKDSSSQTTNDRSVARAWIVPIGVAASTTVDSELREWAMNSHSRSLDRFAHAVNALGTAHVLVPSMAIFYTGSLLTHAVPAQHAALETAAAYAASDVVESILKPVIGRERPHVTGNSHRFHPFTTNGDWHSLPSAHIAHITAIAEAVSMQTESRSIAVICSSLVALVGWDRIYEDQHWTSDVTATAALSAVISRATVHWVASHWDRK